jgi:hypothetical protein
LQNISLEASYVKLENFDVPDKAAGIDCDNQDCNRVTMSALFYSGRCGDVACFFQIPIKASLLHAFASKLLPSHRIIAIDRNC